MWLGFGCEHDDTGEDSRDGDPLYQHRTLSLQRNLKKEVIGSGRVSPHRQYVEGVRWWKGTSDRQSAVQSLQGKPKFAISQYSHEFLDRRLSRHQYDTALLAMSNAVRGMPGQR